MFTDYSTVIALYSAKCSANLNDFLHKNGIYKQENLGFLYDHLYLQSGGNFLDKGGLRNKWSRDLTEI